MLSKCVHVALPILEKTGSEEFGSLIPRRLLRTLACPPRVCLGGDSDVFAGEVAFVDLGMAQN